MLIIYECIKNTIVSLIIFFSWSKISQLNIRALTFKLSFKFRYFKNHNSWHFTFLQLLELTLNDFHKNHMVSQKIWIQSGEPFQCRKEWTRSNLTPQLPGQMFRVLKFYLTLFIFFITSDLSSNLNNPTETLFWVLRSRSIRKILN